MRVHPRDDPAIPLTGVFSTRSADRPNPIGLHQVRVLRIDGTRIEVGPLEAARWPSVLQVIGWSSSVRRDQEGAVKLDSRLLPQLNDSPGTFWSPPLMAHSLENMGATDLRVIAVEVKHPAT